MTTGIKKRVAFFEFPFRPGLAPLASAYLQSVALQTPRIAESCVFETHVYGVSQEGVAQAVVACDADVYALSTYVWNGRLVRDIVKQLSIMRPHAQIILGGPQVMQNADSYLDPARPNVSLCNGEGEYTFADYLLQLLEESPDFAKVNGLSFSHDGQIITTPMMSRVANLDEIPSPFLNGLIDPGRYSEVTYETNRGCPFKCTYCFWGGATNAKVNKFGVDRVFDELTWLSENRFQAIFIIDANFGMLPRDLEIAKHLADLKRRTGFPKTVFFNSSKNTPARVTEITKVWNEVGLITAQPVSLQTVSPDVLKNIKRDNIKHETYSELQRTLNSLGMQSFLEMIWPLPGETLASFRDGLDQLCRMQSDAFAVYPLMLINNVEMALQKDIYALETVDDPNPHSEAQVVVATGDVTNEEYRDGINTVYHVTLLHTFMALRRTMDYLDAHGIRTYSQTADGFWQYCLDRKAPHAQLVNNIFKHGAGERFAANLDFSGYLVHEVLHVHATEFEDLLYGYCEQEGWLANDSIRLRFEVDLLNRPLLYSNQPIVDKREKLDLLTIASTGRDAVTVEIGGHHLQELLTLVDVHRDRDREEPIDRATIRISYRSPSQMTFSAKAPSYFYHIYCQGRCRGDIRSIWPRWEQLAAQGTGVRLLSTG